MHHWFCLHHPPRYGRNVECFEVVSAGGSPLDCQYMTDFGRHAINSLDFLVRDILKLIFEKETKEEMDKKQEAARKKRTIPKKVEEEKEHKNQEENQEQEQEDNQEEKQEDPPLTKVYPTPLLTRKDGKVNLLSSYQSLNDMLKAIAFFPGVIKTGCEQVHHRLHQLRRQLGFS